MLHFVVLTQPNCPWCDKAKALITERGALYTEIQLDDSLKTFIKSCGATTVPQVILDDEWFAPTWIGGYQQLKDWYS